MTDRENPEPQSSYPTFSEQLQNLAPDLPWLFGTGVLAGTLIKIVITRQVDFPEAVAAIVGATIDLSIWLGRRGNPETPIVTTRASNEDGWQTMVRRGQSETPGKRNRRR